ncbi:hypothetical protein K469DRAFT_210276 [Zopfia rhizophila CBS 207.26]|uniref:Uncharacterized protein n=1 Tax=Zopfia rhizophila CBS 207.26 TaxID=1314779 RepID=A0A6A6DUE5_9PEZI|nr:hypothetical protein K469DRAFT_210276 [Zopfia rhizophila CBS 207.26]
MRYFCQIQGAGFRGRVLKALESSQFAFSCIYLLMSTPLTPHPPCHSNRPSFSFPTSPILLSTAHTSLSLPQALPAFHFSVPPVWASHAPVFDNRAVDSTPGVLGPESRGGTACDDVVLPRLCSFEKLGVEMCGLVVSYSIEGLMSSEEAGRYAARKSELSGLDCASLIS